MFQRKSPLCSLFLRRGGAVHCRVTGVKHYSADLEQEGLDIPCILKFEGDGEKLRSLLDKTQKLMGVARCIYGNCFVGKYFVFASQPRGENFTPPPPPEKYPLYSMSIGTPFLNW